MFGETRSTEEGTRSTLGETRSTMLPTRSTLGGNSLNERGNPLNERANPLNEQLNSLNRAANPLNKRINLPNLIANPPKQKAPTPQKSGGSKTLKHFLIPQLNDPPNVADDDFQHGIGRNCDDHGDDPADTSGKEEQEDDCDWVYVEFFTHDLW